MDVTILIPTLNRSEYILRILEFYKKSFFTGQILILDSSTNEEGVINKENIKKFSKNLDITYIWDIGWSFELIKKYQKYIKKKNCIFSGDDDYIIVDGLKKCSNFLNQKKNKEIVAVSGRGLTLGVYGKNYDKIFTTSEYKLAYTDEKNPLSRIQNFFKNYAVSIYSLCRTDIFKKVLEYSLLKKDRHKCSYNAINGELLPCSIMVSFGRIDQIETPLVIRTVGHSRFIQPPLYQNIDKKIFKKSQSYLIKSLNNSIFKNYGIKKSKIKIKLYFDSYISLSAKNDGKKNSILLSKIYFLKKIKNYIFFITSFFFNNSEKSTNLYSLHYGLSSFSKDFIKINKIIKKIKIKNI
jgi:glycosyltransferase domain-containing protein